MVLTIQNETLRSVIGARPFVALPQEEIDRLHGSIEVDVTKQSEAIANPSLLQLVAITVMHYNYSWFSSSGLLSGMMSEDNAASLGLMNYIQPDGYNDIFLDESLKAAAASIVNNSVETEAGYNIRLAGMLYDNSPQFEKYFGLVFIARLRQPGVTPKGQDAGIHFYGSGELQQNRDWFNSWSRILIDHLVAL